MFETFWAKTNPKPSLIGALMYEPSAANVSGAVNEAAPKFSITQEEPLTPLVFVH